MLSLSGGLRIAICLDLTRKLSHHVILAAWSPLHKAVLCYKTTHSH